MSKMEFEFEFLFQPGLKFTIELEFEFGLELKSEFEFGLALKLEFELVFSSIHQFIYSDMCEKNC